MIDLKGGNGVADAPTADQRFAELVDHHHQAIHLYCLRRLPAMDASLSPEKRAAGSKIRRYEYDAAEGFHLPVGDPIDPAPLP